MLGLLSLVAKNFLFHTWWKLKPLIAALFMKSLFILEDTWWTWRTFDLCFSFNSILINERSVVMSFFKSLYSGLKKQDSWQPFLIRLFSKALRNSVTLLAFSHYFYIFVLQTCPQQSCVGQKYYILCHLWNLCSYIPQLHWIFLHQHVLGSYSASNLL